MSLNKHNLNKLPKGPKVHWWAKVFGGRGRSNRSESGSSQDSRTAGWIGAHGSRSSYEPSSVSTNSSRYAGSESYFNHRPTHEEYYPRPPVAAPPLPLAPPSAVSGYAPPRPMRPPTKAPALNAHTSAQHLTTLKSSTLALAEVSLIGQLKLRPEDSRDSSGLGLIDGRTIGFEKYLGPGSEQSAHLRNILGAASVNDGDIVFKYGDNRNLQLNSTAAGQKVVLSFKVRWYSAQRINSSIRAVNIRELPARPSRPLQSGAMSTGSQVHNIHRRPLASNPALTVTKRPNAITDPLTDDLRRWRILASINKQGTRMKGCHGTLKNLQVHKGTKRSTETLQDALKGYTVNYRYDPKLTPPTAGEPMLVLECSLIWDDEEKKVFAERIRAHRT